jgi:hypothetical protein
MERGDQTLKQFHGYSRPNVRGPCVAISGEREGKVRCMPRLPCMLPLCSSPRQWRGERVCAVPVARLRHAIPPVASLPECRTPISPSKHCDRPAGRTRWPQQPGNMSSFAHDMSRRGERAIRKPRNHGTCFAHRNFYFCPRITAETGRGW